MVITRIGSSVGFDVEGRALLFATGDFKLTVTEKEKQSIRKRGGIQDQTMAELFARSLFCRWEEDGQVAYFRSQVEGWTETFAAAARHGHSITARQLLLIAFVMRNESFRLVGEEAYDAIKGLWSLTPGASHPGAAPLPKNEKVKLDEIELVKFIDEEFRGQVSLHLVVADEILAKRLRGKQSQNITWLGKIFVESGIRPWVRQKEAVVSVPIEKLDLAKLLA